MNKSTNTLHPISSETLAFWVMTIFSVAGIYFRLKGLGDWSFTNDEYYLAQSARYIMQTGLPKFPCGGYYTRGLLYQYIMVPFIAIGFKPELAFRLVPVLSHIAALPGLYLLSRKVSGKIGACLIVSVFSLSIVEVEISRFARMYLPFQAIFIWYVYFLNKFMLENNPKSFRWMLALSAISPFLFEGGIFLSLLNFFLIIDKNKISTIRVISAVCIFLMAYVYLSNDFRFFPIGKQAYFPPELPIMHGNRNTFFFPYFFASALQNRMEWLIPLLILTVFSAWNLFKISRDSSLSILPKLCLAICIALSLCNLFGLLALTILILLLLNIVKIGDLKDRLFRPFTIPISANLVFYTLLGIANLGTIGPLANSNNNYFDPLIYIILERIPPNAAYLSKILNLLIALFYYPTGLPGIFYVWTKVSPVLIVFTTCCFLFGIFDAILRERKVPSFFKFNASVFLFLLLVVSALAIDKGTRYTFFLYPIFILLSIDGLKRLSSIIFKSPFKVNITTFIIFFSVFIISNDFSLNHLYHYNTPKFVFKIGFRPKVKSHLIMRRDYKGVADYIDKNALPDDIVISAHQTVQYYTSAVGYILLGYKNNSFGAYSSCGGKKERWTNANLLYKTDQLFDLIKHSNKNIWIVVNVLSPRYDESAVINKYSNNLVYLAQDQTLGIFKISKVH